MKFEKMKNQHRRGWKSLQDGWSSPSNLVGLKQQKTFFIQLHTRESFERPYLNLNVFKNVCKRRNKFNFSTNFSETFHIGNIANFSTINKSDALPMSFTAMKVPALKPVQIHKKNLRGRLRSVERMLKQNNNDHLKVSRLFGDVNLINVDNFSIADHASSMSANSE